MGRSGPPGAGRARSFAGAARAPRRPARHGGAGRPAGSMITSRSNPLIRELRAQLRGPSRRADRVLVEGWRALETAAAAGASLDLLVYTPDAAHDARLAALRAAAGPHGAREVVAAPDVYAALAQVATPQGVIGLARRPVPAPDAVLAAPDALIVVLDAVQDPGNVGTIVRTAAAVGATAVLTTGGTADPFGPKALRAAAGTAFLVPLRHYVEAGAAAAELRGRGIRLMIAGPLGGQLAADASFARPLAMIFGNEGAGPGAAWSHAGAETVRLPVANGVESLNVAAAAAILLYRARGFI